MTPSITIRIDYGAETVNGEGARVSASSNLPTPHSSGLAASTSGDRLADGLPTPLDNAAQTAALGESGAPAPSPSLIPAGGAGSPSGVSGGADVPTPFDSVHGSIVVGDQAPTPDVGNEGGPGKRAADSARQGEGASKSEGEGPGRKGKK
jgi:hypothetical protein